jgi:hypothetical protein
MKLTTGNNLPPNEYAHFVTTFSVNVITSWKRTFIRKNKLDLLALVDSVESIDRSSSYPAASEYKDFSLKDLQKLILAKNNHFIVMTHLVTKKVLGIAVLRVDSKQVAVSYLQVVNAEIANGKVQAFFNRYIEDIASKCLHCRYFMTMASNKNANGISALVENGYMPHTTMMCKYIKETQST